MDNGDKFDVTGSGFAAIMGIVCCLAFVATIWICQGCTVNVEYDKKSESEQPKVQINDLSKNCKYGTFDGHEYVIYNSVFCSSPIGGITHSPNCPCQKNKVGNILQ